jgi:hypothetical protein
MCNNTDLQPFSAGQSPSLPSKNTKEQSHRIWSALFSLAPRIHVPSSFNADSQFPFPEQVQGTLAVAIEFLEERTYPRTIYASGTNCNPSWGTIQPSKPTLHRLAPFMGVMLVMLAVGVTYCILSFDVRTSMSSGHDQIHSKIPTPVIAIPSRSSRILPNFQPLLCVFSTAREVLVFLIV